MLYVAQDQLLPILVAVLIGFLTGLWIWRARRTAVASEKRNHIAEHQPPSAPTFARVSQALPAADLAPRADPVPMSVRESLEPDDVITSVAAAATDIAGEFLGVDAHPGAAADDLGVLKGVGPKFAAMLTAAGITSYAALAALSMEDLVRIDAAAGAFKGRILRDKLREQAGYLARGDREGFEREFGRL